MTTLTCFGGAAAQRPKRNEYLDHVRPTLRCTERAGSLATWESRAGRTELSDHDLRHRTRRERSISQSGAGQSSRPRQRVSAGRVHSGRSREPSSAERKVQSADLRGRGSATRRSQRRTRVATHAARRSSRPCREVQRRTREIMLWKRQPLHTQSEEG